jgi:uncharacterized membrane protein
MPEPVCQGDRMNVGNPAADRSGDEHVAAEGDYAGTGGPPEDNSLGRLLALSDGVFAIAMTLLALDLRVPDVSELPEATENSRLMAALFDLLPNVLIYLLSFYIVANYWIAHHRLMRSVTRTHPRLVAHTLPLLLLVGALPFPAGLLGHYGSQPIALVVYGAVNVLAVSSLLWLRHDLRAYALSTAPADEEEWTRNGLEQWGNLVVFALCIPAGYVLGAKGPFVLLLLAVSGRVATVLARRQARRRRATAPAGQARR